MNCVELHQEVLDFLKSNFVIKVAFNCRDFDNNPEMLIENLSAYQGQYFSQKDKILLVHMDTDYYDPLLSCGTIPINVVRVFKNLDIPLHSLLFVTNHFGITKEFNFLLAENHPNDRPTIVETLLSSMLLTETFEDLKISFDDIEKPAICMMNKSRSHRVAFYNFIRNNNLFEKIAVSQSFNVKKSN